MILFTAKYAWHSAYTHARTRSLFLSLSLSFIHTQKRLCVWWNGFLMTSFYQPVLTRILRIFLIHRYAFRSEKKTANVTQLGETRCYLKKHPLDILLYILTQIYTHTCTHTNFLSHTYIYSVVNFYLCSSTLK